MDAQARIEQMVVILLLVILTIGCFLVLRPFLSALLWALILSFSAWPLYARLLRALGGRRTLAAGLMTLLVSAVLILPPVVVGSSLADNVTQVVTMVRSLLAHGLPGPPDWVAELPLIGATLHGWWQDLSQQGSDWTAALHPYLETGRDLLLSTGVSLGQAVLQLSLSVLAAFFFFRDGAAGGRQLDAAVSRLAGERARGLLAVAGGTIKGVVYGIMGTALAQAILQVIGLWLTGVPAAGFLGFLTFFLSFVPMGPALVWLPASDLADLQRGARLGHLPCDLGLLRRQRGRQRAQALADQPGQQAAVDPGLPGRPGRRGHVRLPGRVSRPDPLALAYTLVQEWLAGAATEARSKTP